MSASVNIGGSSSDKKVRVNAIDPPKELFITGTGVTVTDNPTLGRYDIAITGGSTNPLAKGTALKSGDSTTKVFTFAHGMTNPPVFAVVVPESTDALGSYTTTWDSTNITITYPFAPPATATNNLSYAWFAMDINGGGGQAVSGGGGSGEINTSSNAGIDGIGLVLPKSGVNLPFKALNVGSSRLSITDDTTDHTVDFDVNEGSLNIGNMTGIIGNSRISDLAYSKLTSIPSTIVQTNQSNTFGNFGQAFYNNTIDIYNTARTAAYILSASAIGGNRVITLPLLTANDQFTFDNFVTTLTNKTMDAGSNTFTNLNNAAISLTAAIAYSKLNLTSSIVNADISGTAAIAKSKLAALNIGDSDTSTYTTTKISTLSKALLNSAIVYNDQSNTFGAFDQIFPTSRLKIANPAATFNYIIATSAITADRTITLPLLAGNDTMALIALAQTLTNKTIDAGSNTITNIADANIASHTSTKISITNKSQLNSSIAYIDQSNTFSAANDQIIPSTNLKLSNSSFLAALSVGTLAGNITLTLPSTTDTVVGRATTDTLTNKTVNATNNTITDTSTATGDILKSNGTKFVRLGKGTANQVLAVNAGATDVAWASFNAENTGTANATGNGATTVFNIPHSLGSIPSVAFIQCSSHTNLFTYTYDITNIIVTFTTAPPAATVVFQWRAVA